MMKSFSKTVRDFTHKNRLLLFITLAFVLAFAPVFVSVSTADFVPSGNQAVSSAAPAERFRCTVECDGTLTPVSIGKCRVGELLTRLGITLDKDDIVSPGIDEYVCDSMAISVTRVSSFTVVEETSLPYETRRIEDPDMHIGSEAVDVEGVNGTLCVTSALVFHDGALVSRGEVDAQRSVEPVEEIVRYGTAPYDAAFDASGAHSDPNTFIASDVANENGGGTITLTNGSVIDYSSVIPVSATAYTTERQSFKLTYTGTTAHVGGIAVDPKVIPLGTKMYIVAADGSWTYGYAVAEDIGGGIKTNKVDLFFDTYNECIYFGVRNALVYIIG